MKGAPAGLQNAAHQSQPCEDLTARYKCTPDMLDVAAHAPCVQRVAHPDCKSRKAGSMTCAKVIHRCCMPLQQQQNSSVGESVSAAHRGLVRLRLRFLVVVRHPRVALEVVEQRDRERVAPVQLVAVGLVPRCYCLLPQGLAAPDQAAQKVQAVSPSSAKDALLSSFTCRPVGCDGATPRSKFDPTELSR